MVTAGAITALIIKTLPYVLIAKAVGGIVDVTVHYVKVRISKRNGV